MNKITEEAMTNMIRRIEILESQIKKMNSHQTIPPITFPMFPGQASKAQTDYLSSLGGKVWVGMTKQEAGKGIDERTGKNKDKKMSRNVLQCPAMSREIVEPKEVETDDAGLDEEDLM